MSGAQKTERDTYRNLVRTNYVLGALGIILLVIIFTLYISADYSRSRNAENERLRLLATTSAARFGSMVNNLLITMRFLDQWIQDHPDKDPRFDPEFIRYVDVYRSQTGRRIDLRMVSDSGGLFYLPSESKEPRADVSDREYYSESKKLRPDTLYFANPVQSRVTGKWGIPITYRLRENKHDIFLLFGALEFEVLDEVLAPGEILPDFSVGIIRSDRTLIYRDPYDPLLVGNQFHGSIRPGDVVVVDVGKDEPNQRLFTYQTLNDFALGIEIAESWSAVRFQWIKAILIKAMAAAVMLALYMLLTFRMIGSQKRNNEIQRKLQNAARYDSLTGLKNRGYFFERFGDELDRAQRYRIPLVFMILDIDHFKVLNDTMGHPEGDSVLKRIAGFIDNGIRSSDIAGRVGGEEFALILADVDLLHAVAVAERIRERVTSIIVGSWKASISIGAVAWKGPEESLTDLYKRADGALYRAKAEGRNRVIASTD